MKNRYIISAIVALSMLLGCYEDKGNYERVDINELTIMSFSGTDVTKTVGEKITITPKLIFANGSTDESHLSFEWSLNGETSPELATRNLDYTTTKEGRINVLLRVKDNNTGVVYLRYIDCNVRSIYDANGWLTLSEKDGNSVLSFMKYTKAGEVNENTIQVFDNLLTAGREPLMLQEHYCADGGTKGAIFVFQNSGSVDVNGLSFEKSIDAKETFVGGVLPLGVTLKSGVFMDYVDVLVDQEGKLYSRIKPIKTLFHSSYFMPSPLQYENEVLKNCTMVRGIYSSNKFSLGYDNNKKRIFVIFDGATSSAKGVQFEASKISMLPAKPSNSPVGFIPLNNFAGYDIISANHYRHTGANKIGYSFIFRKISTGEYFRQDFVIFRAENSTRLTLSEPAFTKINGLVETPSAVCVLPYMISKYILIAVGKDVYLYSRTNSDTPIKLYKSFDSPITALDCEVYENRQACVALENGQIVILNMENAQNISEEDRVIYTLPMDKVSGRIVDVKHKVGSGNGWGGR